MRRAGGAVVLALAGRAAASDGIADARAEVRRVLARPEFQPLADADRLPEIPRIESSWLRAIVDLLLETLGDLLRGVANAVGWLLKQLFGALGKLFSGLAGSGAADGTGVWGSLVTWAVVAAAAALLVWLLLRLMRAARTERRAGALALQVGDMSGRQDDALARTPEDWRRRAERLAAAGDRAAALRALYLELLAGLHRLGAIDYDRSRTNTAYVFDLGRGHRARPAFLMLTRRFDRAVYGAHDPTDEDLEKAMHEVDAVRGAFSREAAGA